MTRFVQTSLWTRPKQLWEHRHIPTWSQRGQRIATKMVKYVCEIISYKKKELHIPRVLAYEPVVRETPMGERLTLPWSETAGAAFFPSSNHLALLVPGDEELVLAPEYPEFADNPVIGSVELPREDAFALDLAHEMAHWVVDRVLQVREKTEHGKHWKLAYALLRERFIKTCPVG